LDYFPAGSWPIVGVVSNCASPNALYFVHRPLTGSPARKSESPFQSQPSCFAAPRPSDTITRSLTKHFTSPLCCTTTLGLLSTTFFYLSSSITACKFDGIASVATLILPSPCPGNDTSSFAAVLRHPSPPSPPIQSPAQSTSLQRPSFRLDDAVDLIADCFSSSLASSVPQLTGIKVGVCIENTIVLFGKASHIITPASVAATSFYRDVPSQAA
jgi:hypothetical protein